jgi:type IV pilus assembly protein PilC
MPSYKYSAVGTDGRTVSGRLDASNKTECVAELRKRSLTPIDIQEKGGSSAPSRSAPSSGGSSAPAGQTSAAAAGGPGNASTVGAAGAGGGPKPVEKKGISFGKTKPGVRKREEAVIFTRQLATMIGAGIPMLESLEILKEQAESKQFSALLDYVIGDVRAGQDLSTALERHPKAFTNVYTSMVRAGEASGQIDEILVRLADYMESAQKLKREIKSAMTYPIVSLVMIFGITAFLMIGIVPKFEEVFKSLDITLPALTKGILNTSRFATANWALVLAGMVVAGGLVVAYKRTEKGGYQWDWLMLHLPIFGQLFRKVGLSRFAKTCSTMIKSGVPILGTLEIVQDTSGNRVIAQAVERARESVRQGESLMGPLSQSPVFPPMVTRMIGIGEKTGALEVLLEKISEFYDEQVSATVKQLTSLIEPLMIGTMGIMVGTIVLAVFLPIFELQKQLAAH